MSKGIDLKRLWEFFDKDLRLVKEHEFRRAVFTDGVEDEARETVWKFLFQLYPFNSTNREREIIDKEKYVEYHVMKHRWNQVLQNDGNGQPQVDFTLKIEMNNDQYIDSDAQSSSTAETSGENIDYIKLQTILKISRMSMSKPGLLEDVKQIDKDIDRTGYLIEMSHDDSLSYKEKNSITSAIRNILITFAAFNQNIAEVEKELTTNTNNSAILGYTQGMNELASLFVSAFRKESEAYWCFSNFMLLDTYSTSSIALNTTEINPSHVLKTNVAYYFTATGMWKKLKHLSYLLSVTDSELFEKFNQYGLKNMPFCHEWLLLYFKRCFTSNRDFYKCFELFNSHFIELHNSVLKGINVKNLYSFDLFVCLSLLKQARNEFLTKCDSDMDIYETFSNLNKTGYLARNLNEILIEAGKIFDQYCIICHTFNENDLSEEKKSTLEKLKNYFFN